MRLPEYQTEVKAIGLWGKWPCAIALRPSDLVCACAKRGLKYKDKSQKTDRPEAKQLRMSLFKPVSCDLG